MDSYSPQLEDSHTHTQSVHESEGFAQTEEGQKDKQQERGDAQLIQSHSYHSPLSSQDVNVNDNEIQKLILQKQNMQARIEELESLNHYLTLNNEETMDSYTRLCYELEFNCLLQVEDLENEKDLFKEQMQSLNNYKAQATLTISALQVFVLDFNLE